MNTLQKAGLLQLLPQMTRINAIECSIAFQKAYSIKIDWHEFGYYLDELRTKGILETYRPIGMKSYSGMTEYRIVTVKES